MWKTILIALACMALLWLVLSVRARRSDRLLAKAKELFVKRTIEHDSVLRTYYLYMPPNESIDRLLPLVLVFHGGTGNALKIARKTMMHELANLEEFMVIYPNGCGRGKQQNNLTWNAGSDPPQSYAEKRNVDDVGFVRQMLKDLIREFPVDTKRIYAVGFSQGGMFTYRLASELSEYIAAIAPVSATMTVKDFKPHEPVAVIHIHGAKDENVPFLGGRGRLTARGRNYPPVIDGLKKCINFNGGKPEDLKKNKINQDTTWWHFEGRSNKGDVSYCLLENIGHEWPGTFPSKRKGESTDDVNQPFFATEQIWRFFEEHPKH